VCYTKLQSVLKQYNNVDFVVVVPNCLSLQLSGSCFNDLVFKVHKGNMVSIIKHIKVFEVCTTIYVVVWHQNNIYI
jgi:hypothetical protein